MQKAKLGRISHMVSFCIIGVSNSTRKNNTERFHYENTVKLEQFKEVTEGRIGRRSEVEIENSLETIRNLIFQEESNEIKVESNGFIWIRDSYFYFLIISKSYEWICKNK